MGGNGKVFNATMFVSDCFGFCKLGDIAICLAQYNNS